MGRGRVYEQSMCTILVGVSVVGSHLAWQEKRLVGGEGRQAMKALVFQHTEFPVAFESEGPDFIVVFRCIMELAWSL